LLHNYHQGSENEDDEQINENERDERAEAQDGETIARTRRKRRIQDITNH